MFDFGFDRIELVVSLFFAVLLSLPRQRLTLRDRDLVITFGLRNHRIAGGIGGFRVRLGFRVTNSLVRAGIRIGQLVSGLRISSLTTAGTPPA